MKVSVVIVDSRSKEHPDWVEVAKQSVKNQIVDTELIVIDNTENKTTIGKAYNKGVNRANGDWVLFLGDDDYISDDYVFVLKHYVKKLSKMNCIGVSTNMTVFNDEKRGILSRPPTGMYNREYLLKYPFNEELKKGIDREYLQEIKARNDRYFVIQHHHGYFYRHHGGNTARPIKIGKDDNVDIYVVTSQPTFIDPYMVDLKKDYSVGVDDKVDINRAKNAKVVWCEWADENALKISQSNTDAYKILRIHAYEVFGKIVNYIDFSKFDKVIFVAEHIKEYLENEVGKIDNAVIIPQGVDTKKFDIPQNKKRTRDIVYAGHICRKKGIGELDLLARYFKNYTFHIAGRYKENDVAEYFKHRKPDNVKFYPWQYELEKFYQDKSYVINTSLREGVSNATMEGMSAGLKPIVRNWIGSDEIFGEKYTWESIYDIEKLLDGSYNPQEYRNHIKENYNFNDTYNEIKSIIVKGMEQK